MVSLAVVIPAHNAAATLAETLDSLLAQTRRDWQAIIVDDGSTDDTRALAERYAARDSRFRLLSDGRPSEGVSAARNRGIAASTDSRWLLFLDADDWIDPGFTTTMLGALEAHPGTRVGFCSSISVTPDGRHSAPWLSSAVARNPFEVFARRCLVAIHTFVLDRALVTELGGFDPALRTAEDWDLWQRIARSGVAFMPIPGAFAYYRARRQSLSRRVRPLLADSTTVITRGFAPDPRVPHPDPRYAGGADPVVGGTAEMAIALAGLWTAAHELADGHDGSDLIVPLPDRGNLLETCRQTILDGLTCGACTLLTGPFPRDPQFVGALRGLLERVERAAAEPGLARLLEFSFEAEIFSPDRLTERLVAGRSMFVRVDPHRLVPIEPPAGVDTLNIEFRADGAFLARAQVGVDGPLSVGEQTALAIQAMSPSVFLHRSGVMRQPGFWLSAAAQLARLPATLRHARPRRGSKSVFRPRALARRVLMGAALARADAGTRGSDSFARVRAEARAEAAAMPLPSPAARAERAPGDALPPPNDRATYWDAHYRTPDPWAYDSPYEQLKYQRTLSLLPKAPIRHALELACSEGQFTAMLAPRAEHLVASDISHTALERARVRCRAFANVEYRRLDFIDDPLPHDLDLLVCSEVLYYLPDRTALGAIVAKLCGALAPGGRLLTAHAHVLKDDPTRTGFDWGEAFGVKTIAETFAATPGVALEHSLSTELYRIDLWRRLAKGDAAPVPRVETVELGPPPEPAFAHNIVWGGAEIRRSEAQACEATDQLPILMYHRIANDGPSALARYRTSPEAFADQMRWLRRNGYHSVTTNDLLAQRRGGHPFRGRPVLITFDDGYRDFHDAAWPVLRAHDFTAEVMVVTGLVGKTAEWDVQYGRPAPLMGWPEIQALATAGVRFGSHMASHSHMEELSSRAIVREAAGSKALLERALSEPCPSIAAPFGEASERFVRIARECGYAVGFTIEPGIASPADDPLGLPRIEVLGAWSLDAFASAVRARHGAADPDSSGL